MCLRRALVLVKVVRSLRYERRFGQLDAHRRVSLDRRGGGRVDRFGLQLLPLFAVRLDFLTQPTELLTVIVVNLLKPYRIFFGLR